MVDSTRLGAIAGRKDSSLLLSEAAGGYCLPSRGAAMSHPPEPNVVLDPAAIPARKAGEFRRFYDRKYMVFVAVFGNGIFYIQAGQIFASQSAKDVSAMAFAVSFWAVSSWFVYGLLRGDRIIIAANIIAMIGAGLVLLGCALFG